MICLGAVPHLLELSAIKLQFIPTTFNATPRYLRGRTSHHGELNHRQRPLQSSSRQGLSSRGTNSRSIACMTTQLQLQMAIQELNCEIASIDELLGTTHLNKESVSGAPKL